jgi:hypothetical protein
MYTLCIPNRIPLSQNRRSLPSIVPGQTEMDGYRTFLQAEFNRKYPGHVIELNLLYGKVFWIHRTGDAYFILRDADNFSKPLWDALEECVYDNDRQIRFRQAAKLQHGADSLTVNVEHMDDTDYEELLNFHLDATNTNQNWLYIEIGDFKHTQVKFGER